MLSALAIVLPANAQEDNNPEGLKEVRAVLDNSAGSGWKPDDAVWQQAEVIDDFHPNQTW